MSQRFSLSSITSRMSGGISPKGGGTLSSKDLALQPDTHTLAALYRQKLVGKPLW